MEGGSVRVCSQAGQVVIFGASGIDSSDMLKRRLETEGKYRMLAMME